MNNPTEHTCRCTRPAPNSWLCPRCRRTLEYALVNVGVLHGDLDTVSRRQVRYSSTGATKGSIGRVIPLPVDGRFVDADGSGTRLRDDIENTIRRYVARTPNPTAGITAANPTAAGVRHLATHFDWVARQPWSDDMYRDLISLERRLSKFVDAPPSTWYAGECGHTDEHATCTADLYGVLGEDTITCPACGITHQTDERRDFLLKQAEEHLVTASTAARALLAWTDYDGSETKLVRRIDAWRDREQLEVRDVTSLRGRDRHVYRLGDIQTLLIAAAQAANERRSGDSGAA